MAATGGYAAQRRAYKGAHRGEGDEEMEEEKFELASRKMEKYEKLVAKNTEFFSTNAPEDLMFNLEKYLESTGAKYEISKDKYKVKAVLVPKDSSGSEEEQIHAKFQILQVDEDKLCMEMSRSKGDAMVFFEQFNQMKEFYGPLANATYA
jgi:hypothetical protein